MLNVVMFGAPGSGKGTQSDNIVKKYNLMHISSGELLRHEIRRNSDIGRQVRDIISKGHLASDEIINKLIRKTIKQASRNYRGFIFDGYPRTVQQAKMLDEMLAEVNQKIEVILNLDVEEDTLVTRLLSRGQTSGRNDDNLTTIKNRLEVYKSVTMPILDYYSTRDCYTRINNNTTMEDCFTQVTEAVDNALNLSNAINFD